LMEATMRGIMSWAIVVAAVAAVSCDSPSAPRASAGPWLEPDGSRAFAVNPAIVARASGAAHRDAFDAPVILNFSAVKHANGAVQGQFYFRALGTDPDQMIRVTVTCLTVVDGNRAWVGGIVEDAFLPNLIGVSAFFFAFDNGEGADAEPDVVSRVTVAAAAGAEQAFCANAPAIPAAMLPIEILRGNVNVEG
jgi:hypothetical protein